MENPTSTTVPQAVHLGNVLLQMRGFLMHQLDTAMQAHGISIKLSQMKVMLSLYSKTPVRASDLARTICYDPGAMTRLLDGLNQQGLLTRTRDEADRRTVWLLLTPEGAALKEKLKSIHIQVMEAMLAPLTQADRDHLLHSLQTILDHPTP